MSEIIFIYKNKEIIMLCGKNEKLGIIFKRFCQKTQLVKKNIQFLFGGEIINYVYKIYPIYQKDLLKLLIYYIIN